MKLPYIYNVYYFRVLSPLSSNFPWFPGSSLRANLSSSKYSLLNKPNQIASTQGFHPQVSGHLPIMCPLFPLSLLLIDFDPVRLQTALSGSNPLKGPSNHLVKTIPTVPFSHQDCKWSKHHSPTLTQSEFLRPSLSLKLNFRIIRIPHLTLPNMLST